MQRREAERHLVGDEQLRRRREHPREREHLLLAARERARLLAAAFGEHREHLERVVERGAGARGAAP